MKKISLLFIPLLFLGCNLIENKIEVTSESHIKDYFSITTINAKVYDESFLIDKELDNKKTYAVLDFFSPDEKTNISLVSITAKYPYLYTEGVKIDMDTIPEGIIISVYSINKNDELDFISNINDSCSLILNKKTKGIHIVFENTEKKEFEIKISDIKIY